MLLKTGIEIMFTMTKKGKILYVLAEEKNIFGGSINKFEGRCFPSLIIEQGGNVYADSDSLVSEFLKFLDGYNLPIKRPKGEKTNPEKLLKILMPFFISVKVRGNTLSTKH